jgi:hypothetical protein
MLLHAGDEAALEQYALEKSGESKELSRWWGTLLASRGDVHEAMSVYQAAQDTLSQVCAACEDCCPLLCSLFHT